MLTALEKDWRDYLFRPLTSLLNRLGVTANGITITSFILLLVPIAMHFQGYSLPIQIALLAAIGIADAIDGPMARNNRNVTVLGIWLDHIRDGALVAWATYLLYDYGVLDMRYISIVWGLELILIWTTLKDFIFKFLRHSEDRALLVQHISHNNLQATVLGRLQFFFWTVGYLLLFFYIATQNDWLLTAGESIIIIEIIFAAMNILEAYRKFLPKG